MTLLYWLGFAIVLFIVGDIVLRSTKSSLTIDPAGRMQLWKAILLLVYLSAAAIFTAYLVVSLWIGNPAQQATPKPVPPESACNSTGNPEVRSLDPDTVSIGSGRNAVHVLGCDFLADDKVSLDGVPRETSFVSDRQLVVQLRNSDFAAAGDIVVSVTRPAGASGASRPSGTTGPTATAGPSGTTAPSGTTGPAGAPTNATVTLHVRSASDVQMTWNVLGSHCTITEEVRLILLILFTGAFGSSVYALKSLADYIGARKLSESWFTFYFIQPIEGAGIAFIFYVLLRGGLLVGTSADLKSVNPFGISAIAVLVGVFSDKAFQKLGDLFDNLFTTKKPDDRGDKLDKIRITTKSPLQPAKVGEDYKQQLEAINGAPPYKWSITPDLPNGLSLDKNTGVIGGKPTVAKQDIEYTVTVTDSANATASSAINFAVQEASAH